MFICKEILIPERHSRKIFAGPRLKRLRRDRHLTQAAMAAELDVSASYLNLMERNQRPITVQVLIRLTDVYGIDPQISSMKSRRGSSQNELTRRLLRVTLADYFAGAVMMPYGRFLEAAELAGYDVELLAARFGASFEQVAHRMTTLAQQTARGVPFFLIRVDIAGNVSKRFSSSRFPFAHFGGTCALWNIHAAFAEPGRILTQTIELPDGTQWFSIARTVHRSLTSFGAIEPRFAIGLGCEIKYAKRLVYAKRIDFNALDATPIGINCRLCDRPACPQRAAPPALRKNL